MALIFPRASLTPGKLDLVRAWLPSRPWYDGVERELVGAFRFDDPDGEVGMETHLLRAEGAPTLVVPVTYRGRELPGADEHLIGTSEHSELGRRWFYDGAGDPAYVQALVTAVLTGGGGADYDYDDEQGQRQRREPTARVRGTGSADAEVATVTEATPYDEGPVTVVNAGGGLEVVLARVLGASELTAAHLLLASWGGESDVPVAGVR